MTTEDRKLKVYMFDEDMWALLQGIKTRLYNDKPLTNDQRRDLANAMDAVMHMAWVDHG